MSSICMYFISNQFIIRITQKTQIFLHRISSICMHWISNTNRTNIVNFILEIIHTPHRTQGYEVGIFEAQRGKSIQMGLLGSSIFQLYSTPPNQKILLASFHMEEEALVWFRRQRNLVNSPVRKLLLGPYMSSLE